MIFKVHLAYQSASLTKGEIKTRHNNASNHNRFPPLEHSFPHKAQQQQHGQWNGSNGAASGGTEDCSATMSMYVFYVCGGEDTEKKRKRLSSLESDDVLLGADGCGFDGTFSHYLDRRTEDGVCGKKEPSKQACFSPNHG